MKLLRAFALSLLVCVIASAQNANLMPMPKQQFFDANGVPLAGGFIYTCTAGLACPGNPLASYTDSTAGTANTNPVVLDAGGFAQPGIWLSNSAAYKIVAWDANSVSQWSVDNVASAGLLVTQALATPLPSLTVTGNATIGGSTTLAALSATTGSFSGAVTISGNATVGGTLGVTGAATLGNVTMNDGTTNLILRLGPASHGFQIQDVTNGTIPFTVAPAAPTNSVELNLADVTITLPLTLSAVPKFAGTNSTGGGAALLGANSPAVTLAAPYIWITVKTADGSTGYIPVWK